MYIKIVLFSSVFHIYEEIFQIFIAPTHTFSLELGPNNNNIIVMYCTTIAADFFAIFSFLFTFYISAFFSFRSFCMVCSQINENWERQGYFAAGCSSCRSLVNSIHKQTQRISIQIA